MVLHDQNQLAITFEKYEQITLGPVFMENKTNFFFKKKKNLKKEEHS